MQVNSRKMEQDDGRLNYRKPHYSILHINIGVYKENEGKEQSIF